MLLKIIKFIVNNKIYNEEVQSTLMLTEPNKPNKESKKKKGKNDKKMYFKIRFGHAIGKTKTYGLIMFESRTGFI